MNQVVRPTGPGVVDFENFPSDLDFLLSEIDRRDEALKKLSEKLNTISVRANTYGPSFPVTYADALWSLAKEVREALGEK